MSNPIPERELEPSPEAVIGEESSRLDLVPVPVVINGPTRVQALPSSRWAAISYAALGTTPERIVGAEPRRRRVVIATNGFVKVGPTSETCQAQSAPWPGNSFPIELEHTDEVWAKANSGTIELVAIVEYWSD